MTNNYMQEIVRREKNYEFRRYRIKSSVLRVWFYLNAPLSSIVYICEIDPARTRGEGHDALPEDGRGNHEFNTYHKDWDGYNFAYRIRSVRKLRQPLTLGILREKYDFKLAPRGLVYLHAQIANDVPWDEQELVWSASDETETASSSIAAGTSLESVKRKREVVLDAPVLGRPSKNAKRVRNMVLV